MAIAAGHRVTRSAAIANISTDSVYLFRLESHVFAERWATAKEAGRQARIEALEDTAHDRAINGMDKPVFWQGEQVGTMKVYDNALLTRLLRRESPEDWHRKASDGPAAASIPPPLVFGDLPPEVPDGDAPGAAPEGECPPGAPPTGGA